MFYHISLAVLAFMAFLHICFIVLPMRMTTRELGIFWVIMVIALAIFSFYSEPSVSDDLYSHYHSINKIQNGLSTLEDTTMFTLYIIFWLIGKTGQYGLLPMLTVLVWGNTIWHILKQEMKQMKEVDACAILLYFMAAFAGFGIFYIITGIRYSLTVVIWYDCYLRWYPKQKVKYYLVCLILCGLHVGILLLMGIVILYEYVLKNASKTLWIRFGVAFVIVYVFQASGLLPQLLESAGPYGVYVAQKLNGYSTGYAGAIGSVRLRALLVFYLTLLPAAITLIRKKSGRLSPICIVLACASIIFVILYERMSYVVGVASMPIICEMCCTGSRLKRTVNKMLLLLLFGFLTYQCFWAMISHFTFNGMDIKYEILHFF